MSLVNTDGENLQGFFQGFFLALEGTFLEKPQGGGVNSLPPPPTSLYSVNGVRKK